MAVLRSAQSGRDMTLEEGAYKDEVHEPDIGEEKILRDELLAMGMRDGRVWATDDVKDVALDPDKVAEARKLEIE